MRFLLYLSAVFWMQWALQSILSAEIVIIILYTFFSSTAVFHLSSKRHNFIILLYFTRQNFDVGTCIPIYSARMRIDEENCMKFHV